MGSEPLDSVASGPPRAGDRGVRLCSPERARELKAAMVGLPSWSLTARQICDLELLSCGAFWPLDRFMSRSDVRSVTTEMRLANGGWFPLPVTLDVTPETAEAAARYGSLVLRDPEGFPLAVIGASEIWEPDGREETEAVFGTLDPTHPGVAYALDRSRACRIAGRLEALRLPAHPDFVDLRMTPQEVRSEFAQRGWRNVVAFQTRNPMHRAHFELTVRAAALADGNLLIHPVVGVTKPGDLDHFSRVRCYQRLLPQYPPGLAMISLLPLAMRMAGPREAVLHAIIRRNYGCTHFIVGRDHAGPGFSASGRPFYGPYDAQELALKLEPELGIRILPFEELVFLPDEDRFAPASEAQAGGSARRVFTLSGSELRARLEQGRELPSWFTFDGVAEELRRRHPSRQQQGFTVFLTGLSGAGKSTAAKVLEARLQEIGGRAVSLLDGDLVRKHLSSELGFSKEHRDLNVRRIGFVASEITKAGGAAICAPIAPYDSVRKDVRREISELGGFCLVWISTPIEVCESRDAKGLYAKARAGLLPAFTGVSDPYEEPLDAELALDASKLAPEEIAQAIVLHLERAGYLAAAEASAIS